MWVADMEFATPDVVIDGIRQRLDRRIFGYTRVFGQDYYKAFSQWCMDRYGWSFPKEELVMSNGIIPALYGSFFLLALIFSATTMDSYHIYHGSLCQQGGHRQVQLPRRDPGFFWDRADVRTPPWR